MGLDLSLKLGRTVSAPRGTYTRLGDGFQKLKTHLLKKVQQNTRSVRSKIY